MLIVVVVPRATNTFPGSPGGEVCVVLTKLFVRFQASLVCDKGASAVEYGLLLLVIAAVAAIIVGIRDRIQPVYQAVLDALP